MRRVDLRKNQLWESCVIEHYLMISSSEPEDAGFEYSEEDALGAHFVSIRIVSEIYSSFPRFERE